MIRESVREPDAVELDIPGGEPEALPRSPKATAFEVRSPESRRVDLIFASVVTFAPPIAFGAALLLHFKGWYRIGAADVGILLFMWLLGVTGVEVGYHRLFTHNSFKAHRAVRYALAALGSTAFQGPVIWWSSVHRKHHRTSDKPGDPHSP